MELTTTTTPGSGTMVAVGHNDGAFKMPQPRKKAEVLEEDAYVAALEHIITRDFFPDLPRLRLQEELLEAQRLDDHPRLLRLRSQLHRMRTASPARAPTPLLSSSSSPSPSTTSSSTTDLPRSSSSSSSSRPPHEGSAPEGEQEGGQEGEEEEAWAGLGLDGFLRGHTSEDNASFGELLHEANARRRDKYRWLYGEEERVRQRIAARDQATTALLALPSSSTDQQQLTQEEEAQLRKLLLPAPRPSASLDEGPYRVSNALMYLPAPVALSAEEEQEAAARAQAKELVHDNTRLPRHMLLKRTPDPQTDNTHPQTAAWAMLDAGEQELLEQRRQLREGGGLKSYDLDVLRATPGREPPSPKVRGYGFVLTPSPAPHESPIMTWGKVDSTPLLMNDLDDLPVDLSPGPSFQMPKETPREQVAQRLAEKASQSARKRKRDSGNRAENSAIRALLSPSPKRLSTPALSPAAQRLVARKLGSKSSAMLPDHQLRQSYSTPSPARRPFTPSSSTPSKLSLRSSSAKANVTPSPLRIPSVAVSSTAAPLTSGPQKSLTDGLLNI